MRCSEKSRIGAIIWTVLALFIEFLTAASNVPPHTSHAGLKLVFVWLFATLLGVIGVRIGDILRQILKPNFVIARGFSGLLGAKIFWSIGPQTVGLLIGTGFLWRWVA